MAMYNFVRSIAIVAALALVLAKKSTDGLIIIAFLAVLIQAGDGVVGLIMGEAVRAGGPFFTTVLNGVALSLLLRLNRRPI